MALINEDKALELLHRAVEEKGTDYVDPNASVTGCRYFNPDGSPACIVGHVLSYAGLSLDDIEGNFGMNTESVSDLAAYNPDLLDEAALDVLYVAQDAQDCGQPWGVALTRAEKFREEGGSYDE